MADDNSFVVVRTATTPAEAKVLVALLQAEGIQALVDGDTLADEVAISRRVMNLNGVRVQVPARQLEAAKEILAESRVDEGELEAQALAAGPPPTPGPPAPLATAAAGRTSRWVVVTAVVAVPTAIVMFVLWQDSAAVLRAFERFANDRKAHWERTADGWRRVDLVTGRQTVTTVDRDGSVEITRWYDRHGALLRTARDLDHDGEPDEMDELQPDGKHVVWQHGPDHRVDHLEVRAADGTLLRRQHFDGNAFVDDR